MSTFHIAEVLGEGEFKALMAEAAASEVPSTLTSEPELAGRDALDALVARIVALDPVAVGLLSSPLTITIDGKDSKQTQWRHRNARLSHAQSSYFQRALQDHGISVRLWALLS